MNLDCILGGVNIQGQTIPFVENIIEGTTDNVTLNGTQYTDFMFQKRGWTINFKVRNEAQYNALRAVYNAQFSTNSYPNFSCVYYGVNSLPVRMQLNDKFIELDGCQIRDVEIKLTEKTSVITGGS